MFTLNQICNQNNCTVLYNVAYKYFKTYSKLVFISQSENVFINLALEDWFYQNYNFEKTFILLLWKNRNCIVIGRHQNPWVEINSMENYKELKIARRNSGGGTVYHDKGNLNLTFFSTKQFYNRRYNLEIIKESLFDEWGLNCEINSREDILLQNYKISGTASKLGKVNTYHHCTLLVDADKELMKSLLNHNNKQISTNATRSIPTHTVNIKTINPTVTIDRLITVIAQKYLETKFKKIYENTLFEKKGLFIISPEERYFPGITEKIKLFQSWKWIFGRTPKFKNTMIIFSFEISKIYSNTKSNIQIVIEVESGTIQNVNLVSSPPFICILAADWLESITMQYYGNKYSDKLLIEMREAILLFLKHQLKN